MSTDTEREDFEAHAQRHGGDTTLRGDGRWNDLTIYGSWMGWQARAAIAQQAEPVQADAQPVAPRDREADRARFPDPAFNRWLDEGISDAGHTVWDAVGDVQAAWSGWDNRQHYAAPTARQPLTDEQRHEALGSAGPDLLALAKRWADNEIHVYQFTAAAERIVAAAIERAHGITQEGE